MHFIAADNDAAAALDSISVFLFSSEDRSLCEPARASRFY